MQITRNSEATLPRHGAAPQTDGASKMLTASARLRRIADKIEIIERTKTVVDALALGMPEGATETEDRAHLVECEAMLRFLAGEAITGAQYNDLRDCEITNFLGGYHLEPLAEKHPLDAVVAWSFEETTVDWLLRVACRVLALVFASGTLETMPPERNGDLARLRRLVAKYSV
ncbi:hypothetical protein pkur_cds_795 [Pandoravirus kuranda]|uniref:Uncharacterized protein n=1 Tax=Pandoravirus kuranda TaxID=3019033 RepID=A0AA95J2I2_9VIRU|nr:hypothetical protein pkur_cds_795 [Pandoravirus kuranda]